VRQAIDARFAVLCTELRAAVQAVLAANVRRRAALCAFRKNPGV
jgi:hypothetical protein